MQRFYRCDLAVEINGISARRLLALVAGLPPDAAVNRDGKQWTDDREFAARIVERVDYWGAKHAELLAMQAIAKPADRRRFMEALEPSVRFGHPERGTAAAEKPNRKVTVDLRDLAAFIGRN